MSNIKELIRQEIKKRRLHFNKEAEKYQSLNNGYSQNCYGARDALRDLENFLDTLPDEPEQPPMGYDEAYLNKKIAKASKSWKGVDVDKFMDEIRGREPESGCRNLEEAAEEYIKKGKYLPEAFIVRPAFFAGAEWQKKQDEEIYAWVKQLPNPNIEKLDGAEITTSDSSAGGKELLYVSNKSYNIGFRDGMAEQKRKLMEGAEECELYWDGDFLAIDLNMQVLGYSERDKVSIIILPKED